MKKTFEVINGLEKEGLIKGYALGGATALLFYTEPALTFDVDIFVFLPDADSSQGLIDLSPIYNALKTKEYHAEKEHVMIEGIPVQFLPVYNSLIEDTVTYAEVKEYEGIKIKVAKIEYLLAIMIDTNRPKDRERIYKVLDEASLDQEVLNSILKKHSLEEKWREHIERG